MPINLPAPDEPTPDEPLPGGSPTWLERELARRMRDDAEAARVQRGEMTAAVGRLADATAAHNDGATTRHVELLGALRARDAGVASAITAIEEGKSAWRRGIESAIREAWGVFRLPLGFLATGAATYLGARYLGMSPTPTPIQIAQPIAVTGPPSAVEAREDAASTPPRPMAAEAAEPGDGAGAPGPDPVSGDGE